MQKLLSRKNIPLVGAYAASGVINIITWLVVVGYASSTARELALHWTPVLGIDEVGNSWRVFLLPGLGAVGLLANLSVDRMLGKQDTYFLNLSAGVTLVLNAVLCVGALILWIRAS